MSEGADIQEFLKRLAEGGEIVRAAASKALDQFAEQVVGDAQQLCPVKTGTLKGSGIKGRNARAVAADVPLVDNGDTLEKTVGFNTNYAAAVHERLDATHKDGQAKFLEASLRNNQPKLAPFVGGRVKKALG
jgi:hypothetical protein